MKNDLGINFDQIIDTEAGALVTEETPVVESEETQEVVEDEEELIEVNIDPEEEAASEEMSQDIVEESSSLPFKVLVNALHEKGVLSELDAEALENADEDEAEMLISLIKGEISKNVNQYKTGLPSVIKELIENYEENVPLDRLISMKSQQMRLDNITDDMLKENVDLMKAVIHDNYKSMGLSDAKIKKRIQQFEDLDQLEEESLDALNEGRSRIKQSQLDEKENAKAKVKKDEDARTSNLKSLEDDINSTTELVEGMTLTDREKTIIYDSMTKVVNTDINGTPLNAVMVTRAKNPTGFEKLLHYYHSLGLFDIDSKGNLAPNVSKLKAGAKASAMESLTSALQKRQSSSPGSPVGTTTVDIEKLKANIAAMKNIIPK